MNNNNKIFNMSLEKIAMNFFKKIKFGNLKVHFPSGKIKQFIGSEKGVDADIKLNNFALVGKIYQR